MPKFPVDAPKRDVDVRVKFLKELGQQNDYDPVITSDIEGPNAKAKKIDDRLGRENPAYVSVLSGPRHGLLPPFSCIPSAASGERAEKKKISFLRGWARQSFWLPVWGLIWTALRPLLDQLKERRRTEEAAIESAFRQLYASVWLPRIQGGAVEIEKVEIGGRPLQATGVHERVMELLTVAYQ